jgi:hypothetical protein
MPKIDALTKDNKFKKSDYRPWNFIEQFEKLSTNTVLETDNASLNREQIVSNTLETQTQNHEQSVSDALVLKNTKIESAINTSSETLANALEIQKQSVSNIIINNLDLLTGKERELIIFIFKKCQISASLETPAITTDELRSYLNVTAEHLRNIVYRLSNKGKGLLTVASLKNGKAGWRKFSISNELFQKLSLNNSIHNMLLNREQYVNNPSFKPLAEPIASSSSSSSLINKTTTLTNDERNELPEEWQEIDIESLGEVIRFHQGHVKQLFKHGLDLKPVQESIYHYVFDLTENNKAKEIKSGDPLSFFMGIMKRSGYYSAPENYESPQARGRRLFLEQEAKKAQKLLEAEKVTMNAYFEMWSNKLSGQEKIDLVGKDEMTGNGILMQSDKLKKYYKDVVWPAYYQKMLNGETA